MIRLGYATGEKMSHRPFPGMLKVFDPLRVSYGKDGCMKTQGLCGYLLVDILQAGAPALMTIV